MKSENTFWQTATVTRSNRERRQGHKGVIIWFTGLSGSGKSALAHAVEEQLYLTGCLTRVLDGDNLRHGLCADLGFSQADRTENIRRAGETANLFLDIGAIVYQLRAVPWQVRDFNPQRYDRALRRLDAVIRTHGHFTATAHRFLIQATRA